MSVRYLKILEALVQAGTFKVNSNILIAYSVSIAPLSYPGLTTSLIFLYLITSF